MKVFHWVFEWRKSVHYWWSYILFSPECKELTSMLDPLFYRWGVPPVVIRCVHWTMQMWVLQTWIIAQGSVVVMIKACRLMMTHHLKSSAAETFHHSNMLNLMYITPRVHKVIFFCGLVHVYWSAILSSFLTRIGTMCAWPSPSEATLQNMDKYTSGPFY